MMNIGSNLETEGSDEGALAELDVLISNDIVAAYDGRVSLGP